MNVFGLIFHMTYILLQFVIAILSEILSVFFPSNRAKIWKSLFAQEYYNFIYISKWNINIEIWKFQENYFSMSRINIWIFPKCPLVGIFKIQDGRQGPYWNSAKKKGVKLINYSIFLNLRDQGIRLNDYFDDQRSTSTSKVT